MKTPLALLGIATLLAIPASAGDADWNFKPGQVFTYECKTEFHYVAVPITTIVNGQVVRRGGTWSPGRGRRSGSSDPQWEVVTLRATVLEVAHDGTARLDFMIENVSIDTRFDSNGDRATWSSKDSRTTEIAGYKKYEALVGYRFGATIAADGTVLELENAAWPQAEAARALPGREREESAAAASHDPTPAVAWLSLIFATAPERREEWKRQIRMPFTEKLEVRANGKEPIGHVSCVLSKFKTSKEPRAEEPADNSLRAQTLEAFSLSALRTADKKGHNWFSREYGCTLKAEMSTQIQVGGGGTIVSAIFAWEVVLKEVGKTGPMNGPELPADWVVPQTETQEGGGTALAGSARK